MLWAIFVYILQESKIKNSQEKGILGVKDGYQVGVLYHVQEEVDITLMNDSISSFLHVGSILFLFLLLFFFFW
jgi:hypothetical protein